MSHNISSDINTKRACINMHVEDHNKLYLACPCKFGMQNGMIVKIEWKKHFI